MAEETSGIQNKWLLIIAIALGVIVVVIYNAHVKAIKAAQESEMVAVVRVTKDLDVGDRLTADAIKQAEITREAKDAAGDVVLWENRQQILRDASWDIESPVKAGQLLLWTRHLTGDAAARTEKAPPGTVKVTLNIESEQSPGDVLRVGDRINLLGMFSVAGAPPQYYRAISGVTVVGIGGAGPEDDDPDRRSNRRAMRSYRRVQIAVSPDVSVQLANLDTHRMREWRIEVLRADDPVPMNYGKIIPALQELASKARLPESSPATMPVGDGGNTYPIGG